MIGKISTAEVVNKGATFQLLNSTNFSFEIVILEGEGEICRGRLKLLSLTL